MNEVVKIEDTVRKYGNYITDALMSYFTKLINEQHIRLETIFKANGHDSLPHPDFFLDGSWLAMIDESQRKYAKEVKQRLDNLSDEMNAVIGQIVRYQVGEDFWEDW